MRNNFLSKAYGGVTEARHRLYGLGLPRQWKVITSTLLLLFTFAIGQMWGVDYSPLNYNGGSDLPSGYKYYGSSAGTENKPAFSITTYEGHTVFDVTAGGTGTYNKRAIEFTVSEDCTLDIEFYVGNNGSILNLFHGNSTVVHSSTGTTKGDNKYTFSYSFEDITSDQTYSLSGSGSKVYISKITFAPAVACTETAPTSVAVSGGATYDKGDALSNLSAAVTGGTGTMSYQWYRNTTNAATVSNELKLANCTTATLAPSNKVGTYYYYCVASNCAGSVTSNTTAVTINADCSATGDIFTLTMNLENAPTSEVKTPASSTMNIDKYINIDGGDIILATGSSQHSSITTTPRIKLGGSSGYAQITLDCPWQEGDIITFEKTNKIALAADAGGTNKIQLASGTNEYTITKEDCLYNQSNLFVLRDGNNVEISSITITRPVYRTITLEYADGATPNGSIEVIDGEAATKPADPTWEHHRFAGWYNGSDPYDWSETVGGDLTLTAHWTQLYTITYAAGDGTATGDAPTQVDKAKGETFEVAANSFEVAGKVFDYWNDGTNGYNPGDTYTVGTNNVTLTAVWRTPSTMYAITKGAHENGDFTIDPASQEAGEVVTLEATPDADYLFSAWEVVKTEDGTDAGVTVTNGEFTMPGYPVTVNATFVADTRKKVLYVTKTAEATVKENDKLYDALKDIYNVSIVGPASEADQTNYDLVVLHESIDGSSYNAAAVAAAKTGSTPVLNTKSYFYNEGRFGWGAPNAGQSVKGATQNSAYCNIASHPLFDGLTVTDGFFEITDDAAAKCMQPIGEFTSGKEGYTLATTPNNGGGNGCAIHELTPAQRGASAGKYLMISVSNSKLDALNANGQKLFQNAAAYLLDGSASWTPIPALSDPAIAATPSATYAAGDNISLAASATGTIAATTYTWYKGATLEAAIEAGEIKATATAAAGGNTYEKAGCVAGDAGIYWCVMSNGTDCDVNAYLEVTISAASNITFVTAHGVTPSATTGASCTLPGLTASGWAHQGWTASIDVTVDEATVTAGTTIANGKVASFGADVEFTAVWAEVFAVTFNMQDHGTQVDPQNIVSGDKVVKPADPSESGWDFGGWFTDEECTAGNEFDFNTSITAATPLYAKWTAFDGCALLYPALSGDALTVGDPISMQTGSKGGSMSVVGTPLSYNAYGLSFESSSSAKAKVTINNEIQEGTVISLTLVANGTSAPRGLHLYTGDGATKIESLGWNSEVVKYTEATFTYTVKATDVALIGSNEFQLWRNGSVFLKKLTVTNCGDAITFHNLTSAVNIAGKGTVTLGASSVREGYTTTATYSDIDPLYEFVNWTVSGAGASIADASANPATFTMGTEDAVVTLNLQLIPVKFTVNYFDGTTAMGTEQVVVNEHPTASEIKTAKRGYIFEGWAMSSTATASDVVALNTITSDVAATINLYAVYSEFPCPTSGNLFTWVIDPDADEIVYNVVKNVETEMVTAADVMTITGGTVAVGTTSNSATFTIVDGAFKFRENGNNYTRIELNCALQVGDVISYTSDNSANRYMSIYKDDMSGTAVTTAVDGTRKYFVASTESPIYGAYVLYIKGSNSDCSFKTLSIDRLAPATGVSLENATIAIGNTVTPTMTLLPSNDAYYESIAWSIVGEGEGTIANIDAGTGAVTALAAGSVTVQVKLNNDESLKATCTVEVISSFDQVDVTESTVWDMNNVSANAIELTGDDKNARLLLANIDGVNNNSSFNSQALMFEGQHIGRTTNSVKHLAGRYVQFNVTKQGVVSVIFASNGDNQRTIRINDKKCTKTTNSGTYITYDVLVQPGLVEIVGMEGASDNQYIRISKITYTVKETPDYTRTEMLGNGVYGTICVDHNVPEGGVRGVTVYEIAGREPQYGKIAFDEVTEMAAGVPYVFIAHGNEMALYYGETTEANPVNGNGMYGTFVAKTLTELDGIYYFAQKALWSCVDLTSLNLPANRAYVKLSEIDYLGSSSPAPGRKRLLIGVNGAPAVATGLENGELNEAPRKVLINGELFILRGEKMYDAKGQLVK